MEFPKRKPNRLPSFDYSAPGVYFITICTKNHCCIFWDTVGASIARPPVQLLSAYGRIAEQAICDISQYYPTICVDKYAVMPNHIHLLLRILADEYGRPMVAPTISRVVQQLKGVITKRIGHSVWQKLFHDHVIRGEQDYLKIWEYIENNPKKWEDDCFYIAPSGQTPATD